MDSLDSTQTLHPTYLAHAFTITGAACWVLPQLTPSASFSVSVSARESDLRDRIPLLTSSSGDGRDAISLSSLSYTSVAGTFTGRSAYLKHTLLQLCLLSSQSITRLSYTLATFSPQYSKRRTLQNTLVLQFIGGTPSLVQHLQLGPISRTVGFKIMTLINDPTFLCRWSRDHMRNSIVCLLVSLTCESGSCVQSCCTGRLGLGSEVLCGRGVKGLLSG